ncbi:sensor domain-containing protein [Deinococcus puniceus]|uniref:sensor domain-containing protein n=1 Tax=Deinococcus puniceus TaxID=1182568 RepID=UPI000A7A2B3A|nr:EAL domain-containing protein [Deinococcus puniceus]
MTLPTSALHTALRDLLRVHAPEATLLASVGKQVLSVRADAAPFETPSGELIPPDAWLDRGQLSWLTRDGALLGLLWSEEAAVPEGAVEVLTLLLSAASAEGANREADMLITQLPAPTAWLNADLVFRQVSRTFLELFGFHGPEVVGQPLQTVFPGREDLVHSLTLAASGRASHLADEYALVPDRSAAATVAAGGTGAAGTASAGTGVWLRGEARPYFGGASAGVLWTVQDVSGERQEAARLTALLDGLETPLALLTDTGTVLAASTGLSDLAPATAPAIVGTPLWTWPCFADLPSELVRDLVRVAASGGAANGDVPLVSGGTLPLALRRSTAPGLLVAAGLSGRGMGLQASSSVVAQVLALSDAATILLDHAGRAQLVSEQAAQLVGLDAAKLLNLSLSRVLGELGVRLHTPEGDPLSIPDLRTLNLPLIRELLVVRPDGVARHMEVRATRVEEGSKPGTLLVLRDLTALRRAQAKMKHDARHDALTGLPNRPGLREHLAASATPKTGAVVCLDADGFGALNAALGRTACDHLLIQLAARLNDLAGLHGGLAARLADDTFAAHLPDLSADEAVHAIQATLQLPLRSGRRDVSLTFALGVAHLPADMTADAALADAEIAMQHAKRQGRAQTSAFHPGLRASVAEAYELEDALRGAIAGEQFTLLYQPAVRLADGQPFSAEALLRWQHPTLGTLAPSRFLPLASRSDLIMQVGDWVVQEALRGRAAIRASVPKHLDWRVSVNLSLEELRRSAGLEHLMPLLAQQGAPDIEVSAGSLLDHSQDTLGLLEQLRTHGARLIVDDFGDGASSLTALTRFPLSGLKLHPTLTARLPNDERSLTLVQATIDLAHRLNLHVTAVGVETQEQLGVLRDLGCDAAQGYAITPPLSADALGLWLAER